MAAALMPVKQLPAPSWQTAFGLGFLSAVFDNIPLTALALKQGGYDWGVLAFTVGFGGSMVELLDLPPVWRCATCILESRSVAQWIRHGWAIPPAYVINFFVMLAARGWRPRAILAVSNLLVDT